MTTRYESGNSWVEKLTLPWAITKLIQVIIIIKAKKIINTKIIIR